ncbi:Protein PLASTID MOVEMENT IMPAIRED 1-RELATED 1 [Quillaja saponaria]|uniref:Protein PLASTID MOVEMENT IMPAIRED 1-RELATED 1 n=1 Tax=Quillaja saponaria TaxID=32244 RepID=A0AAD7LJW9_QUISA|nr:Protein PLASTID MOVEMENT IMPAIRED 1-RELATED 1 [Quillaja saponaria]
MELAYVCTGKEKTIILQTHSSRVFQGVAEFDETLMHKCSVYGNRSGQHHSAKYDAKLFLIYASIIGSSGLDIGKHWVEVTRILPFTLDELGSDKSGGKWTTSFRLAGEAKGASLNICNEILLNPCTGLSKSISFLYQKLDEGNLHSSSESDLLELLKPEINLEQESAEVSDQPESDDSVFTVIERGTEISKEDLFKPEEINVQINDGSGIEVINLDEIIKDDDISLDNGTVLFQRIILSMEELEPTANGLLISESMKLDSSKNLEELFEQENYLEVKSNYKTGKMVNKLLSFDDFTKSVANDFLNMLGMENGSFGLSSDHDPQSPREHLFREFEPEALALGNLFSDFEENEEQMGFLCAESADSHDSSPLDSDLSLIIHAAEEEHERESQLLINRRKAKILEDLETEALLQQWGLYDKDFQHSPGTCSGGFGSPVELPPDEPFTLPPIEEGFGPFVLIKGGGFLQSMNPSRLRNAKISRHLGIQASDSIVLPAKMGDDILEILQHMVSAGVENLYQNACKLMTSEDIAGKTMQQITRDTTPSTAIHDRERLITMSMSTSIICRIYGCMNCCLERTLKNFQVVVGLRIQSGMSNEDSSLCIYPQSSRKISAFGGRRVNAGELVSLKEVAVLQLHCVEDFGSAVEGLMGLSITMDEWLKLDAGIIEGYESDEHILKILTSHHAKITDLIGGRFQNVMDEAKKSSGKKGVLGNNLTVALKSAA